VLFDFFVRHAIFGRQHYVDLQTTITFLFECFDVHHNKNKSVWKYAVVVMDNLYVICCEV